MYDERRANRADDSRVQGWWGRGTPTRVWMDAMRKAVAYIKLTLEQAGVTLYDRAEWRGLVKGA